MYALRVIVALVARDRKAESTSLHTVTYDVPHRFDFGVGSCALLAFIAHHVEADRGMADEIAGIDPEPPIKLIHVLRHRLPVEFDRAEYLHLKGIPPSVAQSFIAALLTAASLRK